VFPIGDTGARRVSIAPISTIASTATISIGTIIIGGTITIIAASGCESADPTSNETFRKMRRKGSLRA